MFTSLFGRQGDKGDTGDQGDPGEPGAKGDKGDKGDTGDPGAINIVDRGDPASVDKAVGDFNTNGVVHDLDLSAIVPEGAYAIIVSVWVRHVTANRDIKFRKKGNSNWYNVFPVNALVANMTEYAQGKVFCNAGRVIEYITHNSTYAIIDLVVDGWYLM